MCVCVCVSVVESVSATKFLDMFSMAMHRWFLLPYLVCTRLKNNDLRLAKYSTAFPGKNVFVKNTATLNTFKIPPTYMYIHINTVTLSLVIGLYHLLGRWLTKYFQ